MNPQTRSVLLAVALLVCAIATTLIAALVPNAAWLKDTAIAAWAALLGVLHPSPFTGANPEGK